MGRLQLMCCLLLSVWRVSWRRWRCGLLRQRWSWGYEVVVTALKRLHARAARLEPTVERRVWAGLEAPPRADVAARPSATPTPARSMADGCGG